MRRLVECVPNFSEGRDRAVIDAIADAIRSTPGCTLLDVDPGASTNRTVYTFVGAPEAVVEGLWPRPAWPGPPIDMRGQKGEHPRVGAMDVCPFVPVSGVTMDDCVAWRAPSASAPPRSWPSPSTSTVTRRGRSPHAPCSRSARASTRRWPRSIVTPEWKPDYGRAEFVPRWGATCAGARDFLIAYNVNVLATKEQAHRIALDVREQGRGPGQPGRLKAVRAIGWWVEEYGLAQVSINLDDFRVTPPHVAFEACARAGEGLGWLWRASSWWASSRRGAC